MAVRTRCRRREPRVPTVDLVEYSPFPRVHATQGRRLGFTRDRSASGMCLEVGSAYEVGSLLRLTIRSIDGWPTLHALTRVAWCAKGEDGRMRVGLSLLQASRRILARVRPRRARAPSPGA